MMVDSEIPPLLTRGRAGLTIGWGRALVGMLCLLGGLATITAVVIVIRQAGAAIALGDIGDFGAGIFLGVCGCFAGYALLLFRSGIWVDVDRGTVVGHSRLPGLFRGDWEIPCQHLSRLSLTRQQERVGRYSTIRWKLWSDLRDQPGQQVEIASTSHLSEAVESAEWLSRKYGIPFPANRCEWATTWNGLRCEIFVADTGLSLSETAPNPHDLDHVWRCGLGEFLTETGHGTDLHAKIREQFGEEVLGEVQQAVTLRQQLGQFA